jgi:hypothetical protein
LTMATAERSPIVTDARRSRPVYELSDEQGHVVDAVCEQDRGFFEAHPDIEEFVRERVPGEFAPLSDDDPNIDPFAFVRVTRGPRPGMRKRRPINLTSLSPELAEHYERNGQPVFTWNS